jgi:hypothetical protein
MRDNRARLAHSCRMDKQQNDPRTRTHQGQERAEALSSNHLETTQSVTPCADVAPLEEAGTASLRGAARVRRSSGSTRVSFGKTTLRVLVFAVPMMALALLGLAARHLIGGGRLGWSPRQMTSAAQDNAEKDPGIEAQSIMHAMRASPNDPKILRTWAAFLKRNGGSPADRVAALRKVVASAEVTIADQAELAGALTDEGKVGEAKNIFDALPEAERSTKAILEMRALLLDATGDSESGDRLRREAWASDAGNPDSQFKLAALDLGSFYEENRRQAFKALWELAQAKDDVALKAAEVLAGHEELSRTQSEKLLALVERHPKASKRQVFLAVAGVLRTHPESKDELINNEVMKGKNYGINDLVSLGLMLDQAGAFRAVLNAIPEEKVFISRELCILRIKALANCKNFAQLEMMLTARRELPISKGHIALLKSYLCLEKGDTRGALSSLTLAQQHATSDKDMETVRRVAAMAEQQGWWDVATASHQWMSESGGELRMAALESLFRIASSKRDASLMLTTAERIAAVQIENIPAQTNLAYLRLLLGSRMESVPAILGKVESTHAASFELRSQKSAALVRAFLCYRFGDKAGVQRSIASITDWTLLPPGQRAVAATLLRFAGKETLAHDLASSLPTLALLAEEQDLWAVPPEREIPH